MRIAFRLALASAGAWLAVAAGPAGASAPGGDTRAHAHAYSLLKQAYEHRESLPADFPGYSGRISVNDDGHAASGTFRWTLHGGLEVKLDRDLPETEKWLK